MGVVVEEKGSGVLQKGWCPVIGGDAKLLTGIVLLLVIPTIILNPLGRSAFVGGVGKPSESYRRGLFSCSGRIIAG
jgi:hypothetical protein